MIKRIVLYLGAPENKGRLWKLLYAMLAITVVSDFLVHREHAEFLWDKIPGWSALFGFLSCVFFILASKFLGRIWLMKDEDYYD